MSTKPLLALNDVLDIIKSFEEPKNAGNRSARQEEEEHLISRGAHSVVSLSDSDSSDDEFADITQRQPRTRASGHHERRVTNTGTILHLLKANVSTGLLAMPKAMSHFGLLAGVLGILILGAMYIYCIHLLLDINRAIVRRVMIDRKIMEIKMLIARLLKRQKKLEKKSKMKKVAEDCATAAEGNSKKSENWIPKFVDDIEVGESSSSSNKNTSNKKSKNWKEKFAADVEVGESSSSKQDSSKKFIVEVEVGESSSKKQDNSKKNTKKSKGKSSPSSQEDPDKNTKKSKEKSSASSQEDPDKNTKTINGNDKDAEDGKLSDQEDPDEITVHKEPDSQDNEAEESPTADQGDTNGQTQESDAEISEDRLKEAEAMILRTLDYPKIVELSFHYGMNSTKWAGKCFKFYVQVLMILTHIGCCCVCFLFVAESLGEMGTNGQFLHGNSFQMVGYAVPIMICLSFIPDRHELTGVTTVAFLLQLCGVLMMLYYFFKGEHSDSLHLYIAPPETWYLYFGIIFYAFEGTGVTLHLESHMEKKQDFRGWTGILNKSMFFVIPLYAIFGALGYWKFGNDTKTSVTFNLPEERTTDLIQVMTALGILLTYPFHLSFVLTPIRKMFIQEDFSDTVKNVWDLVIRSVFVVCTFVMSALVPYLELQLTVLGAVASCFLILVVPPYMSLNSYMELPDLNYSCWRLLLHVFIMLVGVAGTVLGSYTTITNLHLYYPNATIFG